MLFKHYSQHKLLSQKSKHSWISPSYTANWQHIQFDNGVQPQHPKWIPWHPFLSLPLQIGITCLPVEIIHQQTQNLWPCSTWGWTSIQSQKYYLLDCEQNAWMHSFLLVQNCILRLLPPLNCWKAIQKLDSQEKSRNRVTLICVLPICSAHITILNQKCLWFIYKGKRTMPNRVLKANLCVSGWCSN